MECAYTTSELGASHFGIISAHHHISERDKIGNTLLQRIVRVRDHNTGFVYGGVDRKSVELAARA